VTDGIHATPRRAALLATVATLFLAACGGGGGDAAPAPGAPAASGGSSTSTPGATAIRSSQVAAPNGIYDITADGGTLVDISLGMNYLGNATPVQPGDTVRVKGLGTAPWRVTTGWIPLEGAGASATPIVIDTRNLAGNPAPAQAWTARMAPMRWHWVASDRLGRVLLAADNRGQIHRSFDAGQTWSAATSPTENWVSATIYHAGGAGDASGLLDVRALAAGFGGGLYETGPNGWAPVASGIAGVDFSVRDWESVSAIDRGTALAAALNAPIYYRTTAQGPWVETVVQGTNQRLASGWRAVALAQTGTAVAASQDGDLYVSTNLAQGWVARPVMVNGAALRDSWYRAAIARNGSVMAVAGRFNSGLYISRDNGLNWTRADTPTGDYTAVAISADGSVIAATLTNAQAAPGAPSGSVQVSRDGGRSFAPAAMPGSDTNWRAVALSDDGLSMTVAAGTYTTATGQLYTSVGNRTSHAVGSLAGGQGSSVELVYDGMVDGAARWSVRSSAGSFTVQ
jgi:hypothetical protein